MLFSSFDEMLAKPPKFKQYLKSSNKYMSPIGTNGAP